MEEAPQPEKKETAIDVQGMTSEIRASLADQLGRKLEDLPEYPSELLQLFIRSLCWKRLRRDFETPEAAFRAAADPKMVGSATVYIAETDEAGFEIWQRLAEEGRQESPLAIERFKVPMSSETADQLSRVSGYLPLRHEVGRDGVDHYLPYIVPGGRFNEVYGWDSYFIAQGLLEDEQLDMVGASVKHHLTEMQLFGRVLNANRTYYLTRGQPPFFLDLVRTYSAYLQQREQELAPDFLRECLSASIHEYHEVWNAPPHKTSTGLARYYDPLKHFPPETEKGHFDLVVAPHAKRAGMTVEAYIQAYNNGELPPNTELASFIEHDGAVRESGHDTTNAFVGRAAHLNPVCLNSLLYKQEMDIADLLESNFGGQLENENVIETAVQWRERAESRRRLIEQLLWDSEQGTFFDYDFVKSERVTYINARGFYPLWAGLATQEQAEKIVASLLPKLEMPGGLAASDEQSRGPISEENPQRQWDFPAGWAPHQMMAWKGLERYGFHDDAQRLIYKWLHMITVDWLKNKSIVEKYNVVDGSSEFQAEYGNVGQGVALKEGAGFGWTNASYQCGLALLDPAYSVALKKLVPVNDLFPSRT